MTGSMMHWRLRLHANERRSARSAASGLLTRRQIISFYCAVAADARNRAAASLSDLEALREQGNANLPALLFRLGDVTTC
jgi:hypothetical protein